MKTCIWCKKKVHRLTVEHIIPEPIGCPDGFLLKGGEVCINCNNGLAHLDMAIIEELDIPRFMAGVNRKRNRPPVINTRGNLVGKYSDEGKTFILNMENNPVQHIDGTTIGAYGKSERNIKAILKKKGGVAHISFSTTIGKNPKFIRGIYKIAFESAIYFLGTNIFLEEKYDNIRSFVRQGHPQRNILYCCCSDTNYRNDIKSPKRRNEDEYIIQFRLGFINFIVDLSPNETLFLILRSKATELWGEKGWGYLPI